MIKVAIVGADTRPAGELIRLLIDHPDVSLTALVAPGLAGHQVAATHHGLIGRDIPPFTDRFNPKAVDMVFIADHSPLGSELLHSTGHDLKVVALCCDTPLQEDIAGVEYGLSEINRKPLVRGATRAVVPTPTASVSLVALWPLALHLLLNTDIAVRARIPADMMERTDAEAIALEIASRLVKAQSSFNGNVTVDFTPSPSARAMRMECDIPCRTELAEILRLYDSHFDDHNFTFHVSYPVGMEEVEGTDRCVISLSKPTPDTLHVEAVADARLRGGAGEAVHLMNLLFGLHERVGLTLKASVY